MPTEAQLLGALGAARDLGFLGPGPLETHQHHALAFAGAFPAPPARLVDLGSGGGVPGLVLAAVWPATEIVLLDANERRIAFLERTVAELALAHTTVRRGRAEVLAHDPGLRSSFDAVVARSFGPPAVTAECAVGFLSPHGVLVVSEPPADTVAQRWPEAGLRALGYGAAELVGEAPRLVRMTLLEAADPRYPRRVGIPAKRPLF